ncbi:alpha/beta hydrolase [Rathayibacter sp. VKM Ac-2927]|uniref:alpha/beta hydrolase n=1 Tax=Rathayibacter sp. VKM Ac-2927 TaxID=2929478 RepID=UPI001FB25765|nr:alpha/beta hydrolase [Rathayibacter sp. VKM Ac-2927]MCJ1685861.1 alpha/beta hydrolase [Rathayibacter sp. VKM Ac-2927]
MSSIPSDPSSPGLRHASRHPRPLPRRLLSVLATAVAVVLGLALSTVAAAFALTASLPFAIVVWVVLSLLLVFLLVSAVQRLLPRRPRPVRRSVRLRTPVVVAVVATAAVSALAGGTVLAPIGGSSAGSSPVAPQYWDLSTGSHLAYWKTAATTPGGSDVPIVYLHGGPGAFVTPADLDSLPTLAETGHDVYLFDQAGAGYSADLPLRDYSFERSLADIDAVRERTGADRVILVGHSAGGFLAAAYAAEHPEHVEKAVLIAAGTYDPSEEGRRASDEARAAADARMSEDPNAEQSAPLPLGTQLRLTAGLALLRTVGPDAAVNLLSQDDGRRATATLTGQPSGLNIFSNTLLNADFEAHWETTLAELGAVQVPTLLVRPQYDHVDWRGQHALARAIPGAQTVYVAGADHDPWAAAFERTRAAVSDFLLDRAQPIYTGDADPGLADAPDRG